MGENSTFYLQLWNTYGRIAAYVLAGAAVLILLVHLFRLASTRDLKKKYDYINLHEIKLLWYSSVLVIIALGLFANTLFAETGALWFGVRIFVTIMVAMIIGVIVSNVLRFYYPFYIEKRLKKLRYTPRVSPTRSSMPARSTYPGIAQIRKAHEAADRRRRRCVPGRRHESRRRRIFDRLRRVDRRRKRVHED